MLCPVSVTLRGNCFRISSNAQTPNWYQILVKTWNNQQLKKWTALALIVGWECYQKHYAATCSTLVAILLSCGLLSTSQGERKQVMFSQHYPWLSLCMDIIILEKCFFFRQDVSKDVITLFCFMKSVHKESH